MKKKEKMVEKISSEEREDLHLWSYRIKTEDGYAYSRPMQREELEVAIRQNRVDGVICLCVIMPDIEVSFSANIDWQKSQFLSANGSE